jgi:hypothetical protein
MSDGLRLSICLACGEPLADTLEHAASPRCHDCRSAHAPLRADLLERARAGGIVVELDRRAGGEAPAPLAA